MKFTLPFPPSVNAMFGGGSAQRRFKSKSYKEWLLKCPSLKAFKINYPVILDYTFFWPDKRIRDVGNYSKGVTDFLVSQEVILDDNWHIVVCETLRSGGIDKENPRVEVVIHAAENNLKKYENTC
jgi:Holliday junction resolvase RusA-like endonuclease